MTAIDPNNLIHWVQCTAGSGVLQPGLQRDGFAWLDAKIQPAIDRGVRDVCLWQLLGWTVQDHSNATDPTTWGKIPYLNLDDGRDATTPMVAELINGFHEWAGQKYAQGVRICNYAGSPRLDDKIIQWRAGNRTGVYESIRRNTEFFAGMPLVLDAMAAATGDWIILCRLILDIVENAVLLEGQTIPGKRFGHFFMHRDFDIGRLPEIRRAPNPVKVCLIRNEADLNGADRLTRVAELTAAGVKVCIDVETVL